MQEELAADISLCITIVVYDDMKRYLHGEAPAARFSPALHLVQADYPSQKAV